MRLVHERLQTHNPRELLSWPQSPQVNAVTEKQPGVGKRLVLESLALWFQQQLNLPELSFPICELGCTIGLF